MEDNLKAKKYATALRLQLLICFKKDNFFVGSKTCMYRILGNNPSQPTAYLLKNDLNKYYT